MTGKHTDPVEEPTSETKAVFNPNTEVTQNFHGSGPDGDGPGHGHTDVTSDGTVTYNRDTNIGDGSA